MRLIITTAMLLIMASCGKPDCPSWSKTTESECIVPGGQAGHGGASGEESGSRRDSSSTAAQGGTSGSSRRSSGPSEPEAGSAAEAGAGGRPIGGSGSAGHERAGQGGFSAVGTRGGAGGSSGASGEAKCGNGKREDDETCDGADCPTACPGANGCVKTAMKGAATTCDAECITENITATIPGDGCCPMGASATTDSDCPKSCGNGKVDGNETCDPSSKDKPCPSSCDDGEDCTSDMFTGTAEQCTAQCVHMPITGAKGGDKCCPKGANANTDSDCMPKCGNGVREGRELCDGADCPTSCPAAKGCMGSELRGSASACSAECVPVAITTAKPGDDCCPASANAMSDSDCRPTCGNGVKEGNEICDGDCPSKCVDDNECTTDRLQGSKNTCDARCEHEISEGAVCEGGKCDASGSCKASAKNYSACSNDAACGGGQCFMGWCTTKCEKDADCPLGAVGTAVCIEGPKVCAQSGCRANSDCQPGLVCQNLLISTTTFGYVCATPASP